MFVEIKREGEVTNELSFVGFLKWLEQQPADGVYRFSDANSCAAGRYYTSLGLTPKQFLSGPNSVGADLGVSEPAFLMALNQMPNTFGAALKRLRALPAR
jgi:hypothetical protein